VEKRMQMKIPITPEFTATVTGHGLTKSYLHRFNLINNPLCPCDVGDQSSEHLIYDCKILALERDILKEQIKTRGGTWPTTNSDLIEIYLDVLSKFIKSTDFQKLQ
jgi:hypothetical protein